MNPSKKKKKRSVNEARRAEKEKNVCEKEHALNSPNNNIKICL
jgi:hypothetical protein